MLLSKLWTGFVALSFCLSIASAESFLQQNGLELSVTQKSLVNNSHNTYYGETVGDKTATLELKIRNSSFKDLSAATIEYSIIREQKYHYSASNLTVLSGKEQLEPLRASQEATVGLGLIKILSRRDIGAVYSDTKIYYKIVIKQDGKVLAQLLSTPKFDVMAATAQKAGKFSEELKSRNPSAK
jgi:hypothetical protein